MRIGPHPLAQPIGFLATATVFGMAAAPLTGHLPWWIPAGLATIGLGLSLSSLFRRNLLALPLRLVLIWSAVAVLASQWYTAGTRKPDLPDLSVAVPVRVSVLRTDRQPNGKAVVDFRIHAISDSEKWIPVQAGLRVYADSITGPWWQEGIGYELLVPLKKPPPATNFHDFDFKSWLLKNNIHYLIRSTEIRSASLFPELNDSFGILIGRLRFRIERILAQSIPSSDGQAFARGLLLGSRSWVEKEDIQAFSETGTLHILSVSGLHAGLVALILYTPLIRLRSRFPGKGEKIRVLITLAGLAFYGQLTGWPVSMIRSIIMTSAFLSTNLMNRHRESWSPWLFSLTAILWLFPDQLTDPGFLLSFLAVGAVIIASRVLSHYSGDRTVNPVLSSGFITVLAVLATAPVTVALFQNLPFSGSAANLLIIPLTSLVLIFTFLAVLAAPFPFLSEAYGEAVSLFTDWIYQVVSAAHQLPGSFFRFQSGDWLWLLVWVSLLVALFAWNWCRTTFAAWLCVWIALLALVTRFFQPLPTRVDFIDCGQGDLSVIRTERHLILIDAGPEWADRKPVSSTISGLVKSAGEAEIDWLIVTHPHLDHYGGAVTLPVPIRRLVIGDTLHAGPHFHRWISHLKSQGTDVTQVNHTLKINLGASEALYVVNATEPTDQANNQSLLIRYQGKNQSVLWAGDAEADLENHFSRALPAGFLHASILKISHHGSRTSSEHQFLETVEPAWVVISAGRNNEYGHPHQETLTVLREKQIPALITAQSGGIRLVPGEEGAVPVTCLNLKEPGKW